MSGYKVQDNYVLLMTSLAGLYSGTSAPQGKAGSATDVMSDTKRSIVMQGRCGNDVIIINMYVWMKIWSN